MKNNFLAFLLICYFSNNIISQQYSFKNYNIGQGIISNTNFDIIQSSDNTLWITTTNGLSNFNGKTFTNYSKSDGLCSNYLRTVFEDSKGRIWVGAWYEKLSYLENGKIYSPTHPLIEKYHNILQFYETSDGVIWIFTAKAILQYKDGDFKLVHKTESESDYFWPNDVTQTKDGTIWVATIGRGVAKITPNPFSIEMINNSTHQINNICYSVFVDKKENLWVGSYGSLYKYSVENNSFKTIELPGNSDKNRVWSITQDENETLWMSLYGNGIASFDTTSDNSKEKFNFITSSNGLISDYTYKLIIDNETNKWIITEYNGLVKSRDFAFKNYTLKDGMPTSLVNKVLQLNDTTLVLATTKGIINFAKGKLFNHRLKDLYVHSADFDKDKNLWVITDLKYGIVGTKLKDNIPGGTFNALKIAKDNSAVFSGSNSILIIKNGISKFTKIKKLRSFTITNIKDKFLIGTYFGIKEFNEDSLVTLVQIPKEINAVKSSVVVSNNEVLMGSDNSLIYLKLENGSYKSKIFPKNSFGNLRGFNSLIIDNNDLWIGSDNSISKVNYQQLINNDSIIIEVYDRNLGFLNGETSNDAMLKASNGNLYVGTSEGLLEFSPKKFNKGVVAPRLKLVNVKLFSEKFRDSLYLKSGVVTFPYNKNHITFNLSATSLTYPENMKFKYRLKGLRDSKWSAPSKKNEIIYSYLPAGNYSFEFTADNGFGVWQKNYKTYHFVIKLPFWKTDWFKFNLTALFLGFGYLIIYYTQRKKKLEQKKLTTALLSAQERERKRISKELHDGIGQKLLLIKNSLKLDSKKTPKLVDNTLEDVRTISRNLHPFQLEKFGLTKAIINLVEEVNEFSEIFFSEEIDNIDTYFSEEKEIYLYRIIQECINNIIKHSKATAAKITIKNKEKKIVVTIQDNGIGFNFEKNKNNIKSLGIKSLMERVDFLKGKIHFETPSNKGTVITIISFK